MPSRNSASSSATTILSACSDSSGRSVCAGVTSLEAMTGSEANRGAVARPDELRRVEHAVARILAETERPVEVYAAALDAIGRALGWQLGAVWEVDAVDGRLRCVRTWNAGALAEEFQALSERLALAPGEGLPGRVLASGKPTWMTDAPDDANFPRADAARRSGLHAGFGFPLRSPRGVVGVMEFFSGELREPDARLLATMDALGSQVGQFVARRHVEEGVRASELRLRAMLESALDAVVTMDAEGRVIGWNPAAEASFGYRASEAVGQDMAELIVPPALRLAHRQGLARFLQTGSGVILDRRLELTGMRRDGTEFPVELTAGLDELRELASGLHPAVLSERGLVAALEALALRAPVPVDIDASLDARLPDQVEAAAYYVVAEALANVHKHAGAGRIAVHATTDERCLVLTVVDDRVGGADAEGEGLRGLADRVEALGGRLTLDSPAGGGTRLHAEIPLGVREPPAVVS